MCDNEMIAQGNDFLGDIKEDFRQDVFEFKEKINREIDDLLSNEFINLCPWIKDELLKAKQRLLEFYLI